MSNDPQHESAEDKVKSILDWLALARGRAGIDEVMGLQRRLLVLRGIALPEPQRLKLLDLLYSYAVQVTAAQLPSLHETTLPVSRRIRRLVRGIQDLLEMMAESYLNAQAEPAGAEAPAASPPDFNSLWRAMRCLSWHLTISHLVAAPTGAGIWQQLHSTFRLARRLGLDKLAGPEDSPTIEQLYLANLLVSVVQPASFISRELEFIGQYIDQFSRLVEFSDTLPAGHEGVFWIDADRDAPPHALARRTPAQETTVLYFACDGIAQGAADHLAALESGRSAAELHLPAFAETHAGRGTLKRLNSFWGRPAKRKFPRRRQSYRADLCAGLDRLWQLLRNPEEAADLSEWMITNESPDGYAMMHVSGATEQLRVGDIVALHPRRGDQSASTGTWQICIVRWALSENPEHIELGLQVLAAHGIPAMLALPHAPTDAVCTAVLLLPEAPPLRPFQALVVPTGTVSDLSQKLILLVERGNLAIHELHATCLDERTASIEVFTVELDERP